LREVTALRSVNNRICSESIAKPPPVGRVARTIMQSLTKTRRFSAKLIPRKVKMIESIQHRRSIRKFTTDPINPEKLQSVLEAARLAPSGNNKQPWMFIVVQSEKQRHAVMEACHQQTWMMTAPAFIVAVADMAARVETEPGLYLDENSPHWELKRAIRDTAIAIQNILLEADGQGLRTCWVGFFVQAEIRPVLGIPDDKFVVAVIPIGYPAEHPAARPRKPLTDIVRYEKW